MSNNSFTLVSGEVCSGDFHRYPKIYAGDPQYAGEYFSHCLCGKKQKVTTIQEVDAPTNSLNT